MFKMRELSDLNKQKTENREKGTNRKKWLETLIYGLLSLAFGMAFFFGTLYPSYGLSADAYQIMSKDSADTGLDEEMQTEEQKANDFERTEYDIESVMKRYDRSEIHYRFYFYERWKKF